MIRFKLKPEPAWVSAADKVFDISEIGDKPLKEREAVLFLIHPLVKEVRDKLEPIPAGEEYAKALMRSVLKGWKGVLSEDGEEIPFAEENMWAMFEGGYTRLGSSIVEASRILTSRYEEMNADHLEGTRKNLKPSQPG